MTTICYRGGLGNTARGVCLSTYVYVLSLFFSFFFFLRIKKKDGSMLRLRGSMGYYRASRGAEKRIRENITHSLLLLCVSLPSRKKEGGGSNGSSKNTLHTKIALCCLKGRGPFYSLSHSILSLYIFSFFSSGTIQHTIYIHVVCVSSLLPPSEFHGARWRSVGQTIWEILFY